MSLDDLLVAIEGLMGRAGVGHAVIGAYAVAAWGAVRGTRDLDLLIEPDDVGRLDRVLAREGHVHELRTGDSEDPIASVIRLDMAAGGVLHPIDILAGIRGAPPGILGRARAVPIAGVTVPVASPEDVILLKLRAGSPRDLADAESIVRVQGDNLARPLLEAICPPDLTGALARLLG